MKLEECFKRCDPFDLDCLFCCIEKGEPCGRWENDLQETKES